MADKSGQAIFFDPATFPRTLQRVREVTLVVDKDGKPILDKNGNPIAYDAMTAAGPLSFPCSFGSKLSNSTFGDIEHRSDDLLYSIERARIHFSARPVSFGASRSPL